MPSPQTIDLKKIPRINTELSKTVSAPSAPTKQNQDLPKPISWQAPEFETPPKPTGWYMGLFGITALVVFIMLAAGDYTAALLFMLAAGVIWLYSKKEPLVHRFTIGEQGIQIGDRLYRYEELRSFWIFYEPPHRAELSIRSHKKVMPHLRIPLGSQNPVDVHRMLSRFIPELKHSDSLIDALSKKAGF